MGRHLTGLIAGLLFGAGLFVSEMTNPAKVLGFLDIFGNWDPSLAFVMAGAMGVTSLGYWVILKRSKPVYEGQFQLPDTKRIDVRLIFGAVLFGAGWGLVGLCPGPAIAAISIGEMPALVFLAAMFLGFAAFEFLLGKKAS